MKKKNKEITDSQIYKLMSPDEIDSMIRQKVEDIRKMGGGIKWQDYEVKYRNEVILGYLGQGLSKRRIVEECADRWGVSLKTMYKWVKTALESLTEDNEEFKQKIMDIQFERLSFISEAAVQDGDYTTALKAYDQLHKLMGLYSEKKELEVKNDIIKFDFGG